MRVGSTTATPAPQPYLATTPRPDQHHQHGSDVMIAPELLQPSLARRGVSSELLLGRWRLTLELFGRVFIEDVGAEPGSIIVQLGGFPVKEARFRRDMEKLRNNQQRDLTLAKVSTNSSIHNVISNILCTFSSYLV